MRYITLIILLFSTTLGAQEQTPMSAKELLAGCELAISHAKGKQLTMTETVTALRSVAYIDGYVDSIAMVQNLDGNVSIIDFKRMPPNSKIMDKVVSVIHSNPNIQAEGTARIVVMYAIRELMK